MNVTTDVSTVAHSDLMAVYQALDKAQAIIEFDLDGKILSANQNFLDTMGYSLDQIIGQHHRMFCADDYAASNDYKMFWKLLRSGEIDSGEFKRVRADGSEVWLQASYNPVLDGSGDPVKVVKFAIDVTERKNLEAEASGLARAVDRVQAVIEFELDGTIITANDNFLRTFGYTREEIEGQHHRMFCQPDYANAPDYAAFWQRLGKGGFDVGEFARLDKHGNVVWLQASYNPIFDADGMPIKVVKFATDISERKQMDAEFHGKMTAVDKSQAVIEFNLDGTVITANQNFLTTFGYTLEEIEGQHHRMFVAPEYASSQEYSTFWEQLANGEYTTGEYRRFGKAGDVIWLQASYNPILDASGEPTRVVKFASDITEEMNSRNETLLQVSTPVTKVWDGGLFLPIVGTVDTVRAEDIMNKAMTSILDTQARTLIIDISRVGSLDADVANHLLNIAKAAALMGCETVVAGISPAIAKLMAQLNVDLGAIRTTSTIEAAFREALLHA